MNILTVSTYDVGGGAARIALNLHAGFLARGHASTLLVGHRADSVPHTVEIPDEATRADRLLRRWERFLGLESFRFPGSRRILELVPYSPDVIHAHNLHGQYFDLTVLGDLADRFPILATLHDQWLFTGHCAHGRECERWRHGCGSCPDLKIYPAVRRDATAWNWDRKRRIFKGKPLFVSTPSEWLARQVRESLLAQADLDLRVIPNGVDTDFFKPGDREAARAALGLPTQGRVLLFAAQGALSNPFKDYPTARETAFRLAKRNPGLPTVLLVLGATGAVERQESLEIHFVETRTHDEGLLNCYRASDLLLFATLVDNFPNVILEAMAAGLPVVAARLGGIPEQVRDWTEQGLESGTGALVPAKDPAAMFEASLRILDDPKLAGTLGRNGRNAADAEFSATVQIDRTLQWYEDSRAVWRRKKKKEDSGVDESTPRSSLKLGAR